MTSGLGPNAGTMMDAVSQAEDFEMEISPKIVLFVVVVE